MKRYFWRGLIACLLAANVASCAGDGLFGPAQPPSRPASPPVVSKPAPPPPLPEYRGPATRPFLMGFTQWPADLNDDGIAIAKEYAHAHGDMIAVMFTNGVPWTEAMDGKPFSKDVQDKMSYRPPVGKKLFLSVSPLNKDRRDMAPYWGDTEGQPLPRGWDKEPLNSARVKRAYLNFVLRAVEAMRPDYLAIGVESNVLLSRDQAKWRQLKELHRDTYTGVKKVHKTLPVFFTTEVLHYKRLTPDSKGTEQEKEVADMMRNSDLFAMSLYPHMSHEVPKTIPADFLQFATRFKKGVAVSESGMTSRNVELRSYNKTLYGSDNEQMQFTEFLLKTAARDNYEFVINFATTDSDRLVARLRPPLNDLARIWAYIGMQNGSRQPKPASAVWDGFYRARYQQTKWW